ncbi:hypothetical protein [Sinorhizobium sp. NFACC03]|uniref:hypothetical protein n=1 Tax=Sinorhizobium sp. NFACC03 TaxID=1566295 RepID=UPI0008902AB6|nr:hypothetical protein [Sinorhizobium sp. NFACC03]SDA86131.1 hypothetical protein SAMN03159448_03792 [Sinorhizobium sp. NFACC03]
MIYAINYDLKKKGQDYSGLHEAIKQIGDWFKCLESCWLVDTAIGADAIVDRIKKHFDSNDRLLVTKVTRDYQGLLTKEDWRWIDARL